MGRSSGGIFIRIFYSDADAFVADCAQGFDYMDPEAEDLDMTFIKQVRTLWSIMRDPFAALLEKMGLTDVDFVFPLSVHDLLDQMYISFSSLWLFYHGNAWLSTFHWVIV